MDAMGGGGALFLDGEWESLCNLFSTEQDLAFDHLLGPPRTHLPDDQGLISLLMNPISSPNPNHNSQTCSSDLSYDSNINGINNVMQPNCNEDQISSLLSFDYLLEEALLMGQPPTAEPMDCAAGDHLPSPSTKRNYSKCVDDQLESMEDEAPLPKKRARVSRHAGKRKKKIEAVEEETKARSSNDDVSDDDDSNDSQEVINESPKEILNSNGKKRASRGAATDPQSLYARRRRERINERLRILQTLVPNGTKVDISTMLEEAVNYVKFLQLQIKLLSSDEMWMYAPLAYSGYDMGLYKSFSPYLPGQ